jgi:hypothetical protein
MMFSKKIRKTKRKRMRRSLSLIKTYNPNITYIIIPILQNSTSKIFRLIISNFIIKFIIIILSTNSIITASQNFHFIIYRLIIIFIIIIIISNSINIAFQNFSFTIFILIIPFMAIVIISNFISKIC